MFTEKERIETEMALRGASETTIPAGLAFVSLPLTPPGNPPSAMHHRDFGYDEAASSVSAAGLLSSSSSVDPSYPLPLLSTASHSESGLPAYGSDPSALAMESPRFQFISEKQQSRILSPHPTLLRKPPFLSRSLALVTPRDAASPHPFSRMYGGVNSTGGGLGTPNVKREEAVYGEDGKSLWKNSDNSNYQDVGFRGLLARIMKPGNKPLKKVFVLIILNLAYSATEFVIGLLTGRVGLVSDAFHLSFGCGVLTFSLFAMTMSDRPPDKAYTFGHERLEVLAALTNALFLLFLSFSLAVEALHAFVQDEAEHKHYLIVSAVSNLVVNLLGVWFFRRYARRRFAYRRAQDINLHSICLHVLSDSFRSAGVILASWLLALGVTYAETLCHGLVAAVVFYTAMPLFQASGAILSQMAPSGTTAAALNKCLRQVRMLDDVMQCYNARFWDLVPGSIVGTLVMQVREGADEQSILSTVHSIYNDIGVKDLTVEIEIYD